MIGSNYYSHLSLSENLAITIVQCLAAYQMKAIEEVSLNISPDILNEFRFEVLSDCTKKDLLITYSLRNGIGIVKEIEFHLLRYGIDKRFVDSSIPNTRQFLAIYKDYKSYKKNALGI